MKKVMTIFGAILVASTILTSCGGGGKSEKEDKTESTIVKEEVPVSTPEVTKPAESVPASGIDCDQFIKDYSAFADSYIKLLNKRRANPKDPSILIEYTDAAAKALVMQKNASSCNDAEHSAKILEIANRIAKAAL